MTGPVEFLVTIEIDTGDLAPATVDQLRAAEARRARELAADGSIVALWRIEGRWANAGIWRARDEQALRRALDSLPLRPYMQIECTRLTEHPGDPRLAHLDAPTASSRGRIKLEPLPPLSMRLRGAHPVSIGIRGRRGAIELPQLAALPTRTRSGRPAHSSPPAAIGGHAETVDRIAVRVEVDVTGAVACADAVAVIEQSILAALHMLPAARIEFSRLACGDGQAPRAAVRPADAEIVIGLSHSGCRDGIEIRHQRSDHDLDIHIGPLAPRVVATTFDGCDNGIQFRQLVKIDATAQTARLSEDQVVAFLRDMRSRIAAWPADGRPSPPA